MNNPVTLNDLLAMEGNPYQNNLNLDPTQRYTQREIYNAMQNAKAQANAEQTYKDNLSKGQQLANEFLGQDAFDQAWATQRSSDSKEFLDRMRDQSRGLSAQENAAARGQFEAAIRRSGASARSALANNLAGRGMSGGGYANSQRAALEGAIGDQLIGAERQLLLDNVNLKRQGLQDYGNALNQQERQIRDYLMNVFDTSNAYHNTLFEQEMARRNYELEKKKANQRRRFLGIF